MDLVVTEEEFPDGVRCFDCGEIIHVGACYSERLVSVSGAGTFGCQVLCIPCACRPITDDPL